MRGESVLQADSFHQRRGAKKKKKKRKRGRERDGKTVVEEGDDRGNRLGSSYTCVCTGEEEKKESPGNGVEG